MDRKTPIVSRFEKYFLLFLVENENGFSVVFVQLEAGQIGEGVLRVRGQMATLGGVMVEAAARVQNEVDSALSKRTPAGTGMPIGSNLHPSEPSEELVRTNLVRR